MSERVGGGVAGERGRLRRLPPAIGRLLSKKLIRRGATVIKNSVHSLSLPFFNIFLSYLVVRLGSVALWGAFVQVLILVQLAAHIVGWGNKEYLLRAFSLNPAQISQAWQRAFWSRLVLFLPLALLLLLSGAALPRALLLSLWCLALVVNQSHEVLVVYRRDFLTATLVEGIGVAVMTTVIFQAGADNSLDNLIRLFTLVNLGKAAVWLWWYRGETMRGWYGRFDGRYFRRAFPFFLLGFTGMLQSRVDLYCVNFFLAEKYIGQYQVFINLLIYAQSIALFIFTPFIKSVYRLPAGAILKLALRLFLFGLVLSLPLLALAHLALARLYGFHFSTSFLLAGGLFVIPIYLYLPVIYLLYKWERQTAVVGINLVGISANLILNIALLPSVGLIGAIIASAAAQWLMLGCYLANLWLRPLSGYAVRSESAGIGELRD
jgi:O-antigen/teichoic acid export membrane protein